MRPSPKLLQNFGHDATLSTRSKFRHNAALQTNKNTQPLPLLHFPTRYLLHFRTIYFVSSVHLTEEGRTGTAWKPTEQQNFLTPNPHKEKCSATHCTTPFSS